jgi:crossover junction endodeoxyribonuclease RuvC
LRGAAKESASLRHESASLRVLGIDPGTGATGYGVVERDGGRGGRLTLLQCGVIRPTPKTPLPARIRQIFEGVDALLEAFRPDVVAVEAVFQGKNAKSALVLGHARGAILLSAALRDIEIAEYTPLSIKKAVVGHASATKLQVGLLVQERLRLVAPPRPADAADGVAAALCHLVLGTAPTMRPIPPSPFPRRAT